MSAEKPTIIALHGFTGCGSDFDLSRSLLPEWNWLTPDMPGHGKQAERVCSWGEVEAYIDEIVASIPIVKRPILFAYSMGGRLALDYALKHQDKLSGLVLISTTAGILDEEARVNRKERDDQLADRIELIGVKAFEEEWLRKPIIQSQKNISQYWRDKLYTNRRNRALGLASSLRGLGTGTMLPLWDRLSGFQLPVLLLSGSEDKKFAEIASDMSLLIPCAENFVVERAGHTVHLEQPEMVHKKIEAFLHSTYFD